MNFTQNGMIALGLEAAEIMRIMNPTDIKE